MSMDYLADTVTIIRHFSRTGVIGRAARQALAGAERGKDRVFLSVLSLVEIMYLAQKKRIPIDLTETIGIINESENYHMINLTTDIVAVAERISFPELFDRLIIATACVLNVPLLTPDREISDSGLLPVVWD